MAHNPNVVGHTHVVTYHEEGGGRGDNPVHGVLSIHGDYKSAKEAIDRHAGGRTRKALLEEGAYNVPRDVAYHHPDTDPYDTTSGTFYRIHRENSKGGFDKI